MVCLLTPQEVGKQLNVSPVTVIRLADSGALAAVEIAKRRRKRLLRFTPEAVAQFIAARQAKI
jgi:excisionase family DNA binding protein